MAMEDSGFWRLHSTTNATSTADTAATTEQLSSCDEWWKGGARIKGCEWAKG